MNRSLSNLRRNKMTGNPKQLINYLLEQDSDRLFDLSEHKQKRSLNSNALLWHCLGEIANALNTDKWEVYLQMLKRYGKYTYICVKPNVVDSVKKQWRECEVLGDIEINGQKAIQMLCYFGSSTYDSKEFSILLNGVVSEMEEMGLATPESEELERIMEQWAKNYGGNV
jgi:hypothetical protein